MFESVKKLAADTLSSFTSAFDRVANQDEMLAVVAVAVRVAGADGKIEPSEKTATLNAVQKHPSLAAFKPIDIAKAFNGDADLLNADMEMATVELNKKIGKITDKTAQIRMLGVAKEIAAADGNISKEELAVIADIRAGFQ